MTRRSNVLPKAQQLTEEQFRNAWLLALARLCRERTDAQVALWLGVGIDHLRKNVKSGVSLPTADKIWNLLAHDESAHEEIDREYGVRKVSVDTVCDTDDASLLLSRALVMIHEAEHPEGPGGRSITPQEYLAGEQLMRELQATATRWLERCADIRGRKPRVVA